MKIAILCPVGPLDRYGYQHIYLPVIENLSAFATCLYMYSTTRNRANVDGLLAHFPNLKYVSNETTWFDLDSNGAEVFRLEKIYSNLDLSLEHARRDGMDCSFTITINQYIPERVWEPLRKLCQDMLEARRPFEWFYKRYQLGDRLFHTDTRQPHIFNLQIDNPYHHMCYDRIEHRDGHERYKIERGGFRSMDHVAIVDCPMEMTLQDLADAKNFTRHYSELTHEAVSDFDWDVYLPYYVRKFNAKIISNEPLGVTGQAIARTSRSDFVCWILLEHYKNPTTTKPNIARRLVGFLRRLA